MASTISPTRTAADGRTTRGDDVAFGVVDSSGSGSGAGGDLHVLSEVERVADRVAIIRSGRLLMLESMAGLRKKARHTVEVRFGSPPPAGAFAGVPGITAYS
jgi:ABC-2 type transport system ATP-binding protein